MNKVLVFFRFIMV